MVMNYPYFNSRGLLPNGEKLEPSPQPYSGGWNHYVSRTGKPDMTIDEDECASVAAENNLDFVVSSDGDGVETLGCSVQVTGVDGNASYGMWQWSNVGIAKPFNQSSDTFRNSNYMKVVYKPYSRAMTDEELEKRGCTSTSLCVFNLHDDHKYGRSKNYHCVEADRHMQWKNMGMEELWCDTKDSHLMNAGVKKCEIPPTLFCRYMDTGVARVPLFQNMHSYTISDLKKSKHAREAIRTGNEHPDVPTSMWNDFMTEALQDPTIWKIKAITDQGAKQIKLHFDISPVDLRWITEYMAKLGHQYQISGTITVDKTLGGGPNKIWQSSVWQSSVWGEDQTDNVLSEVMQSTDDALGSMALKTKSSGSNSVWQSSVWQSSVWGQSSVWNAMKEAKSEDDDSMEVWQSSVWQSSVWQSHMWQSSVWGQSSVWQSSVWQVRIDCIRHTRRVAGE